jgi:phage protein D
MISFSSNLNESAFLPASRSVQSITTDPDTMTVQNNVYDLSSDPTYKSLGNKDDITVSGIQNYQGRALKVSENLIIIPRPAYKTGESGVSVSQPFNTGNREERAKQLWKEADRASNHQATAVIPGHPDIFPPMNVAVTGVGAELSGIWQVKSVKHELGNSGYETSLELLRLSSGSSSTTGTRPAGLISPETSLKTPRGRSVDLTA